MKSGRQASWHFGRRPKHDIAGAKRLKGARDLTSADVRDIGADDDDGAVGHVAKRTAHPLAKIARSLRFARELGARAQPPP